MNSAPIAEHDLFWQPRRNPVHARHHRLHDLYAAQMGEGLLGIFTREDKNPEVDFQSRRWFAGNPHNLYFARKIYKQLRSKVLIDADTHHSISVPEGQAGEKDGLRQKTRPCRAGVSLTLGDACPVILGAPSKRHKPRCRISPFDRYLRKLWLY
ncbi:hypothetical protein RBB78_08810 [Tunturiibacter empetritectus]|uniref:hypothetical protein n=1 Tax=Tunturiibacter empetritectus TaxID=3069691 RepID=UPI003D9BDA2F